MQPSAHEELQEHKTDSLHARRMLTLSESRKDDIIKSDAIAQTARN